MSESMGETPGETSTAALLALADKPADQLTIGDRLNLLWTAVRPRRGEDPEAWRMAEAARRRSRSSEVYAQERPQYTNTWVAQQLEERYGVRVTPSYLGKLRHANNPNPSLPVLHALARFFKVDTAFLLPVSTETDRNTISGVRDNLLSWLARAGNMDEAGDVSIELRLTGVTTAEEAQRQVAVALAQWLKSQHSRQEDDDASDTEYH